jgi:beta-glucosidase
MFSCSYLFSAGLSSASAILAEKAIEYGANLFLEPKKPNNPLEDFSTIVKDSRLWEKLGNLQNRISLGLSNPYFLLGVATCTYQDSGSENCPNSQWASWEIKKIPENNRSGKSVNLFALYQTKQGRQEIIDRLQKLGVNTYRFSIEWSHIEPREGEFHKEMLNVYIDLCKTLRDSGILPLVTLHHFSEPQWFHDKGSFEKEENIDYFTRFVKYVAGPLTQPYKKSKNLVTYICTINEPNVEAFSRYIIQAYSPGHFLKFKKSGMFLKGMLKAHCKAYEILKEKAPLVQVGLAYQYLVFETTHPILSFFPRYLNRLINETTLSFFKTGQFKLSIPFFCNIREQMQSRPVTDFVGLQFYARPVLGFTGSVGYHDEIQTLMPLREDPAGLYQAVIKTYNAFKKPILITENGISTDSDEQRARYLERALYSLQQAQNLIGNKNILGYLVWSLCDNFEWDRGMKPQSFGLYKAQEGQLSQEPKKGSAPFIKLSQTWQSIHRAQ